MQSELVYVTAHELGTAEARQNLKTAGDKVMAAYAVLEARIAELESDLLFCVNGGDDLILDRDHWKGVARSLEAGYEQLDDEFAIDHSIQAERIAELEGSANLFDECYVRARAIWRKRHPERSQDFDPDGAEAIASMIADHDEWEKHSLTRLVEQIAEHAGEIDEFNAGFAAYEEGIDVALEPADTKYDVWRAGWAWAAFEPMRARITELEAIHNALDGHVATLNRRIAELER